jgi:hypothetical protein
LRDVRGAPLIVPPPKGRIVPSRSAGTLPGNEAHPDPALRGLALYAQAGMLDPTGVFPGSSLTAGLRLVVGD